MALKWGIAPLLLLILGVDGGAESSADNIRAGGHQEDLQEEILAAMKDSGVLDEWKDKLDHMLYNEVDEKSSEKKKKLPFINEQEREMLRSFIDEYKTDANLEVSTELILGVIDRVQKTPKPNLPQIFVQLGPVIDVIAAISQKTKDVKKIIDRQGPIFNSPAKPKDILHTLTENLKSELLRLRPQQKQAKKEKSSQGSAGGLGLSDYLNLGATLLKGGNGADLMSLLSGDADISSVLKLLPQLIEQGEYKSLLGKMVSSYLSSSPLGAMFSSYMGQVLDSEDGEKMMANIYEILEQFVQSKSYARLSEIIPKVMAAKDIEGVLKVLTSEAEDNWELFFANIKNEDYKENFLEGFAGMIVNGLEMYDSIPRDSVVGQAPLLVNGFLIANKLPGYNSKKPLESILKIVTKAWKVYSPVADVDIGPHIEVISQALSQAYQSQSHGNSFTKLSSKEKKALITRMVDSEIISPVQSVWSAYDKSRTETTCSKHLLCLVNLREVKTGAGSARVAVAKGASLVAGWALSRGSKQEYWSLYKAVWAGAKGEDCSVAFPVTGHTCDTFSWQTQQMMNTQYDHTEL